MEKAKDHYRHTGKKDFFDWTPTRQSKIAIQT